MNILKKTKFLGPMIKYKDKRNHGKRLLLKKKCQQLTLNVKVATARNPLRFNKFKKVN